MLQLVLIVMSDSVLFGGCRVVGFPVSVTSWTGSESTELLQLPFAEEVDDMIIMP